MSDQAADHGLKQTVTSTVRDFADQLCHKVSQALGSELCSHLGLNTDSASKAPTTEPSKLETIHYDRTIANSLTAKERAHFEADDDGDIFDRYRMPKPVPRSRESNT